MTSEAAGRSPWPQRPEIWFSGLTCTWISGLLRLLTTNLISNIICEVIEAIWKPLMPHMLSKWLSAGITEVSDLSYEVISKA